MPLYLVPVHLSPDTIERALPLYNYQIIKSIRFFVVENIRSARRFLKSIDKSIVIEDLHFEEFNKHTLENDLSKYLRPLEKGESVAILSEAGCPAIADPGAILVAIAQQKGFQVVPLVGPSSILLGLMASGFNGQSFSFRGYLPIDEKERTQAFREMQERIIKDNETQIFIETPYRNQKLLNDLIKYIRPSIKLCIGKDLTGKDEWVKSKSISKWRNEKTVLDKTPCIFLLGK